MKIRTLSTALLLASLIQSVCCLPASGAERRREGTEWDVSYWYNANQSEHPRILLVGDSITKGYESLVRNELAGSAYVSFYATSKCVTDRSYLKALSYILDEYDYAVVHFNNGLHSLGTDPADWEKGLRDALALIREKEPEAKIIWGSSTPLKDPDRTQKAVALNEVAAKVCQELGIPTDDLFGLMDPLDREKNWSDTYHFHGPAKQMQAKQVAGTIRQALGVAKADATAAADALKKAETETGPDGKLKTTEAAKAIANSSFEKPNGWGVYPPKPEAVTFSIDPEEKAAKVVVRQKQAQFYYHRPAFVPGSSVELGFRIRSLEPASVNVHVRTQKPPYVYLGQTVVPVSSEWQAVRVPITFPEDYKVDENVLFFVFPETGTYWLDDIQSIAK
jgi:lysophospholipase L1-like esterase